MRIPVGTGTSPFLLLLINSFQAKCSPLPLFMRCNIALPDAKTSVAPHFTGTGFRHRKHVLSVESGFDSPKNKWTVKPSTPRNARRRMGPEGYNLITVRAAHFLPPFASSPAGA